MKKHSLSLYFLLSLSCFIIAALVQYRSSWLRISDKKVKQDFQQTIWNKEKKLQSIVNDLSQKAENKNYHQLLNENIDYYHNLLSTEGFALLIYENDSLQFWSDNSIPVENYLKQICLDQPVEKLNNGWFRILKKTSGHKTTLGLMLIKKEYPIHNHFLEDEFQKDFSMAAESQLIYTNNKDPNKILSSDGSYLFTLKLFPNTENNFRLGILILLNLIGILFLALVIKMLVDSTSKRFGDTSSFIVLSVVYSFCVRRLSIFHFLLLFINSNYLHRPFMPIPSISHHSVIY
ncbi:MAG: hypothetical protein IPP32_07890 [Bacteroidetes bacterium]|nr:hypothetical protein [Bacteroidota bacterium]